MEQLVTDDPDGIESRGLLLPECLELVRPATVPHRQSTAWHEKSTRWQSRAAVGSRGSLTSPKISESADRGRLGGC